MKGAEALVLQPFVSHQESIRHQLSSVGWQRGIDHFFTEKIPFAYTVSDAFAERLIQLLEVFSVEEDAGPITLLELGCGTGLLAYRLLTLLKKKEHPLGERLQIIGTDFSEALIQELKSNPLFDSCGEQLSFLCFNPLQDDFSILPSPDIVLMTYLLDSLECMHVEYQEGELFQWLVQTELKTDASLLYTKSLPPTELTGEALVKHIEEMKEGSHLQDFSKISSLLSEKWKRVPFEKDLLSRSHYKRLLSLLSEPGAPSRSLTPVSRSAMDLMDSVLEVLSERGLLLCYDFGSAQLQTHESNRSALSFQAGSASFNSVFFPLLGDDSRDFRRIVTDFSSGKSQCMAIFKGADPSSWAAFEKRFSTVFSTECAKEEKRVLQELETAVKEDISRENLPKYYSKMLLSLRPEQRGNYAVLYFCAESLCQNGFHNDAFFYVDQLISLYGSAARSALCLKAELLFYKEDYDACMRLCFDAIQQSPYYEGFYRVYCLASAALNLFDEYTVGVYGLLLYSGETMPWDEVLKLVTLLNMQGQYEIAQQWLRWLAGQRSRYSRQMPASFHEEVLSLL